MAREMVDCIGEAVPMVKGLFPNPDMVAGYVTGTVSNPQIRWTSADWGYWPNATHVEIDQGFGSPAITTATVRDVENGAWNLATAMHKANWQVVRPTIYGSMTTITQADNDGWDGDVWLADPNWTPGDAIPTFKNCTVVAIQYLYENSYDVSMVLDNAWPMLQVKEEDMLTGFTPAHSEEFVPFPKGSFKQIQLYTDFADGTVRVAIHSVSKGYSQIMEAVGLTNHVPVTVTFNATDVDGVSLSDNTVNYGWTVS